MNDNKYSMKQVVIMLAIAFSFVTLASYAAVTIPNTFTAGSTISSSQMNANFDALKTAVDAKQEKPALGSFPTTSAGQFAWAHMSCPASGCWIVNSYNSTGGAVTASTYGTGVGGVTFANVNVDTASIQVTAGGIFGAARICRLTSGTGTNTVIVRCDDIAGTAAESDFRVQVIN